MRKGLFGIALGLLLSASAQADVLTLPEGPPTPKIKLPAKGVTMAEVQKQYGTPRAKQKTVGGTAPRQPPITRWDYDGFSVIFERDRIVDVVVPGAPPKIFVRDKLQPLPPMATAPAATPAPTTPVAAPAPVVAAPAVPAEESGNGVTPKQDPAKVMAEPPPADSETMPPPDTAPQKVSPQIREKPVPAK